jgi:hypothetical protein
MSASDPVCSRDRLPGMARVGLWVSGPALASTRRGRRGRTRDAICAASQVVRGRSPGLAVIVGLLAG